MRYCLQSCSVVVSPYLIEELIELIVLDTHPPYRFIRSLRDVLNRFDLIDEDEPLGVTIRDPKDEPIVRAAVAGECAFVVSGDDDLLSLARMGEVDIISIGEFLEMIR